MMEGFNSFYSEIVAAIERTANQRGSQILLCYAMYDSAPGHQHLIIRSGAGLI